MTSIAWRRLLPYALPDQRNGRRGNGSPDLPVAEDTVDLLPPTASPSPPWAMLSAYAHGIRLNHQKEAPSDE